MKKRIVSMALAIALLAALAATPTLAQEENNGAHPQSIENLSAALLEKRGEEQEAGQADEAAPFADEVMQVSDSVVQYAGEEAPLLKFTDIRRRLTSYNLTVKQLSAQEDDLGKLDPDAMRAGLTELKMLQGSVTGLLNQLGQAEAAGAPVSPEMKLIYGSLAALLTSQVTSMESQIASLESSKETGANSINDGINQVVKGVETLYIGIITMEAALKDIQRGIDTLDRAVAILEKQHELGMASAYDVASLKMQRNGVMSQKESLEFQLKTSRITLENMCGYEMKGIIRLESLTMPTAEELATVDYEKTVNAARDRNVKVQNAFYEWWNDKGASETKELAMDAAESDFNVAYKIICMTVGDKMRLEAAAQETVEFQEKTFEIESKKYELGMISYEEYMTAKNNLEQAKSDLFTARLNLFTAYRNYVWGKDYGIV